MDRRRWFPAAAAVAVVVLVGAVALVLTGDDEPGRVATLPAPSAPASPTPAAPLPTPTPVRATAPTTAPAPPAADPDAPVSSDDEPTAAPSTAPRRTAAPAPAPSTLPTPGPAPSGAARTSFGFDAAYGTDEPDEVVVQYGDSSSCPHVDVTHAVRESAERVVVTLEADAADPGRACTADYRQMLVPVRLAQPLGDRVLVDGHRGEAVPVDRSCSRPFGNPPPPRDCTPP